MEKVGMMLFLGAGTSKRFGIKTMGEMSEEFENNAGRLLDGKGQLYREISNALGTNDLEGILSVSNDLSEETQKPTVKFLKLSLIKLIKPTPRKDMSNRVIDYVKLIPTTIADLDVAKELQSKIIYFIKGNCVLEEEEEILCDVIVTYNRLFGILKSKSSLCDIFTTNYDLVIEKYYDLLTGEYYFFSKTYNYTEKREISYTDGFLPRVFEDLHKDIPAFGRFKLHGSILRSVKENVWDPERYDDFVKHAYREDIPAFRLFKLHGSINQYYQNGAIVKKDTLFPTKTIDGLELEDSMIYPMREKEVYKDPFFELFIRLKTSLLSENICIVIGYSFGDEHIRNIFFDAVKRNPKIRIFMINPTAKKIRDDLEHIKDNIYPIEGEFGEERVFEDLKQKLSEV